MGSKTFAWLATGGGAWSLASNWDDITDGVNPSLIVPGAQDIAEIAGATGSAIGTITGSGQALAALFTGNIGLAGSFGFGSFSLGAGGTGGVLEIGPGAAVTAGAGLIASGSALADGANATLTVAGALTLGTGQSGLGAAAAALDAEQGAAVTAGTLVLDASSAAITVDAASLLDVGGSGLSARGALTVEQGALLRGFGDANAYGAVVNNGTVLAAGGELMLGAVSGSGLLQIGAGAVLDLNGRTEPGENVLFSGANGTLALSAEIDAPGGTLAGFAVGDAIDELGSPISAAAYAPTGGNTGVLTLLYGGQVADTFTLLGNYAGDVFLVSGDGAGGSLITVAASGGGGGTLSGGTTTPDQYLWTAGASGAWDNRLNWADQTAGQNPARIAPGIHDLVTIAAPASQFLVVGGPGDAASLAVTGELALAGSFAAGTLALGVAAGGMQTAGQIDLLPGSTLTTNGGGIADGAFSAIGSATLFSAGGTFTMGGGPLGIGLPVTSLSAAAGAAIRLGGLVMGGGSGDNVVTDPTGSIEIGNVGHAAAGAVTVDPGATLSGNGTVDPLGSVIDNGTIDAEGGTLTLGAVTGAGTLTVGAGAALQLLAPAAVNIGLVGAGATLLLGNELEAPSGTISGFVAGDTIDIENDPITGWGFSAGSGGGAGTLTLYYGSTAVANLLLAGSFKGYKFVLAPDQGTGTDITLSKDGGGGGGGGGQGNTDLLSWTNPVSGAWGRASNWTDVTTGQPASAPPGSENLVLVTGPMDGSFQTVSGPAVCSTLTLLGDTAIVGSYAPGTLLVGDSAAAGALAVLTGAVLQSAGATLASGEIEVNGSGAALTVAGTLAMGGGASGQGSATTLLAAGGGGVVMLGGLVIGGGAADTVETDSSGVIEIGTLGGAAAGAVTVDPGFAIAGNGAINPLGAVVDNGTITALGGTLSLGVLSGQGTLLIGAEATLALDGADPLPIGFAGAGGALEIAGTALPGGVISGFGPGDAIVLENELVASVSFTPGAGAGTLTLMIGGQQQQLLLAGDFSNDTFSVLPYGAGSEIVVTSGSGGASGGTTTPDDYVWTGAAGDGQWNDARNWEDVSAGQNPAAVAPGQHDLCTVQGGSGTFLTVTGPADAASLDVLGAVSLSGSYAVGALSVAGTLALGGAGQVAAASANITGGLLAEGGGITVSGTLAVAAGAVAEAASGGTIGLGAAALAGGVLATDSSGSITIGTASARGGAVVVAAGAELAGFGAVELAGAIVDDGTIVAAGGTLALGAVSGGGTLEIGVGATLALDGAVAGGIVIDFAGPGTLSVSPGVAPQAAIADFSTGDAIILPISGITDALYAPTAPGEGMLTLYAGNTAVETLTLLGVTQGATFAAAAQGSSTIITTQPGIGGTGGGMHQNDTNGSGMVENSTIFLQSQPVYTQYWLGLAINGLTSFVWSSPDGATWGPWQPGYANIGIALNPTPNGWVNLAPGYVAVLVEGNAPVRLTDNGLGHGVLVGNGGVDQIIGAGGDDVLIGGAGPGNLFWGTGAGDTVIGNGNDTVVTGNGADVVQTSADRSVVFVGAGASLVNSNGQDTIVAIPGISNPSTINAAGSDLVWGPSGGGLMNVHGGAGSDTVVGGVGGNIRFYGGSGNANMFWTNNAAFAQYTGGSGEAQIFGSAGALDVQVGAGAVTVFGGTGYTYIQGAPGPSTYVVGSGSSDVIAAAGNQVWLTGAANNTLVAGGGDVLLNGSGSFGNNVFWAGNGPDTVVGGHGQDMLMAGGGPATLQGGSGADVFGFINGSVHGSDVLTNFRVGSDVIGLYGYSGGAQAVLATEQVRGGNTYLTLQDGTQLTLIGVSGLNAGSFVT